MNLTETFAVLTPDLEVDTLPVTPGIYAELDTRYGQFKGHVLTSIYTFESDWNSWERHPAGDETVVLLSGDVTLVCETETGESTTRLSVPGDFVVVPRGVWHTARVAIGPAMMLFITPGEGTEHRPAST